uniref:Uncharacterized protein n=1 Tax=Rhizophora mucronata TaxID=61149 RepID=A0A2P2QJN3_RHIMU
MQSLIIETLFPLLQLFLPH